jgi:hypothetical protein
MSIIKMTDQTVSKGIVWRNESQNQGKMMSLYLTYTTVTTIIWKPKGYPIYSKKGSLDAAEEIMFDCNVLAEGTNI